MIQDNHRSKTCTDCGETKPTSKYYRTGKKMMAQCETCKRVTSRREYEARKGRKESGCGPVAETATPEMVDLLGGPV